MEKKKKNASTTPDSKAVQPKPAQFSLIPLDRVHDDNCDGCASHSFSGSTCKLQLHSVEILETLFLFILRNTVTATQLPRLLVGSGGDADGEANTSGGRLAGCQTAALREHAAFTPPAAFHQ